MKLQFIVISWPYREMSLLFAVHWHCIKQQYDLLAMCEQYKKEKNNVGIWEKNKVGLLL
jgi:hypothetical protein